MTRFISTILAAVFLGSMTHAWEVPQRGTAERAALMDAIRPHAEWNLGAPVEFVVRELRMSGDVAFAMLRAQRPGGQAIDVSQTPMVRRGEGIFDSDITEAQVLYKRSGRTWVAVHHAFGATDVWFSWEPLCREYRAVIADYC